jgi:hypothetical protein
MCRTEGESSRESADAVGPPESSARRSRGSSVLTVVFGRQLWRDLFELDTIPTGRYPPCLRYGRACMSTSAQHDSKTKLLDAALQVIRAEGYAAKKRYAPRAPLERRERRLFH